MEVNQQIHPTFALNLEYWQKQKQPRRADPDPHPQRWEPPSLGGWAWRGSGSLHLTTWLSAQPGSWASGRAGKRDPASKQIRATLG